MTHGNVTPGHTWSALQNTLYRGIRRIRYKDVLRKAHVVIFSGIVWKHNVEARQVCEVVDSEGDMNI